MVFSYNFTISGLFHESKSRLNSVKTYTFTNKHQNKDIINPGKCHSVDTLT